MTNLGIEKSPNRVHRNIVPIVPVPPMKSTQTIEYQSLRGRNNKNFIVPHIVYYEKNWEIGATPNRKNWSVPAMAWNLLKRGAGGPGLRPQIEKDNHANSTGSADSVISSEMDAARGLGWGPQTTKQIRKEA